MAAIATIHIIKYPQFSLFSTSKINSFIKSSLISIQTGFDRGLATGCPLCTWPHLDIICTHRNIIATFEITYLRGASGLAPLSRLPFSSFSYDYYPFLHLHVIELHFFLERQSRINADFFPHHTIRCAAICISSDKAKRPSQSSYSSASRSPFFRFPLHSPLSKARFLSLSLRQILFLCHLRNLPDFC